MVNFTRVQVVAELTSLGLIVFILGAPSVVKFSSDSGYVAVLRDLNVTFDTGTQLTLTVLLMIPFLAALALSTYVRQMEIQSN